MTGLSGFLQRLSKHLGAADVGYMVTGSVASTLYGDPRSTQDIDIVIEISTSQLGHLLLRLERDGFYVSSDAARDAIRHETQFNVIDPDSGWKADLIVKKHRAFSESEFGRRERMDILGVSVWVATAEDIIVSKLEWSHKSGGPERQLRDVAGILAVRRADLDREYVARWCDDLGIRAIWDQLKAQE